MDKRGVGVVVVSVFIILLTVSAIAITWLWVLPLVGDMESSGDTRASLIIVLKGYTVYDVGHEMAIVQIKRGIDDVDVDALDVIFVVDGSSFTFRTKDSPENNGIGTYYFDFAEAGIVGSPDTVKVVPVFFRESGEEIGTARGEVSIPIDDIILDDWDAARARAADNVLKGTPVGDDIFGDSVSVCKDDFVDGEVYVLDRNYRMLPGATCFKVGVDNVVLDLNGYAIFGNYSGYGVHVTGKNVVVKNGRIEKFEKGVFIDGAGANDANQVIDNSFFDNNNSVYVLLSSENFVTGNNMLNGSFTNIYLDKASRNKVADNWACGAVNDILCVGLPIGNYGAGNTFGSTVNCPTVWLNTSYVNYVECED